MDMWRCQSQTLALFFWACSVKWADNWQVKPGTQQAQNINNKSSYSWPSAPGGYFQHWISKGPVNRASNNGGSTVLWASDNGGSTVLRHKPYLFLLLEMVCFPRCLELITAPMEMVKMATTSTRTTATTSIAMKQFRLQLLEPTRSAETTEKHKVCSLYWKNWKFMFWTDCPML